MVLEKLRSRFRARMHVSNPRGWLSPDELDKAKKQDTYSLARSAQGIRFSTAAKELDFETMTNLRQEELRRKTGGSSILEGFPPDVRKKMIRLEIERRAGTMTMPEIIREEEELAKRAFRSGQLKITKLEKKK